MIVLHNERCLTVLAVNSAGTSVFGWDSVQIALPPQGSDPSRSRARARCAEAPASLADAGASSFWPPPIYRVHAR